MLPEVIMQNFSIQQKGTGIAQTCHLCICKLFQLHHYLIKLAAYVIKNTDLGSEIFTETALPPYAQYIAKRSCLPVE